MYKSFPVATSALCICKGSFHFARVKGILARPAVRLGSTLSGLWLRSTLSELSFGHVPSELAEIWRLRSGQRWRRYRLLSVRGSGSSAMRLRSLGRGVGSLLANFEPGSLVTRLWSAKGPLHYQLSLHCCVLASKFGVVEECSCSRVR
jgi:hypothetical protein